MTNTGKLKFSFVKTYYLSVQLSNFSSRPEETEVSLGKHWKNMKGTKSKFTKPFVMPS